MIIIPSNYSIYLNNTLNYNYILDKLNKSFFYIYDLLIKNKKISTNFKNEILEYPKYLSNFKPILEINQFDQKSIQEITYEDNENILSKLDLDTLLIQKIIENIAKKKYNLEFEVNLEKSFIYSFNDLYDFKKYLFTNTLPDPNENLYYNIVGPLLEEYTNNCDFIQCLLNFYVLNNLFNNITDFKLQISKYFISFDVFNKEIIKNDFKVFINTNKDELKEILTNTILTHIYLSLIPAQSIKDIIYKVLEDNIIEIENLFNAYIDNSKINFNRELSIRYFDVLNISVAKSLLIDLLKTDNILKDKLSSDIKIKEENFFNKCLETYSEYTIKNNIYLLSLYRYWPLQFINALPIVIQNYVQRFITSDVDYEEYISKLDLNNFIYKYINSTNIDYDNYVLFLNDKLRDNNYLLENILLNKVNDFTIISYFIELFDNFIKSEEYSDLTKKILESVFKALNKDGLVNYDFNYYDKVIYIDLLFKVFFRYHLIDKNLYGNFINNLNNIITDIYTNVIYSIQDEELIGNQSCLFI
jgi:hypothetical protein